MDQATGSEAMRLNTEKAIQDAAKAWSYAPAHIRAMAGAYVEPLIRALSAVDAELREKHYE